MSKKKHHEEEHVNHERWLVSYADFITLLFVLFVVLYSMSKADVVKFEQLRASLNRAFNVGVLDGDDGNSINRGSGGSSPVSFVEQALMQSGKPNPGPVISTMEELRAALREIPDSPASREGVQVGVNREGVVISLSGNVLFDSGRADLKPEGLDIVDVLAARLVGMPNEIRIEGHTDDVPITTALYPTNWELSSARATTVARYLSERGVPPGRLIAAGFGEFRPVAPNDTRDGRARNRRVDIVILTSPVNQIPSLAPFGTNNQPGALP